MNQAPRRDNMLGLIGGMSWHSTMTYYRFINERVAAEFGGHASAEIAMRSVDFEVIRDCQIRGDWDRAGELLAAAGRDCVNAGAKAVAICTNLMHKVAPAVEAAIGVPLIHIGDSVASQAESNAWTRLGLLGTSWTMEEAFYSDRLARRGIEVRVPSSKDRAVVDDIIWSELTRGIVTERSRASYVEIIERLGDAGAEAIVLACTEIGLLIAPEDSPLPIIDSARAHALDLSEFAVGRTSFAGAGANSSTP